MDSTDFADAASRLCTACGMCCNGVLFHIVRLGPEDSVAELERLGMKLSRKKKEPYFNQPCRFLSGCRCGIYDSRPSRCRQFECKQLHLLSAREVSEDEVMQLIADVKHRVERIESLLEKAGDHHEGLPLGERCAQVVESGEGDTAALAEAMTGLTGVLNRNFRVQRPPGFGEEPG